MDRFTKAIHYVLENEDGVRWDHDSGEYTNDPRDPGGATKWGVVLEEYQRYDNMERGIAGQPSVTWTPDMVQNASRDLALLVYQKFFWGPIQGDAYLEESAAIAIMDTAVNKGLGGARIILTDACHANFPGQPWEYKPVLAAVNAMHGQVFLDNMVRATNNYITARIAKYPAMQWAEKGWRNRAARLGQILAWSPQ